MTERFGSLHFIPQSEALDAELLQREMEEVAAASTTPSSSGGGGNDFQDGKAKEAAHSSVRDNMDTTNGNCPSASQRKTTKKDEGTAAAASSADDTIRKTSSAAGKKEGAAAVAAGADSKEQHQMCQNDDASKVATGMDEPSSSSSASEKKNNTKKKSKEGKEETDPPSKLDIASMTGGDEKKASAVSSASASASASGGINTSCAASEERQVETTTKKDDINTNTNAKKTAATTAAAADHADEKKDEEDDHGKHHGKHHGHHHHGHHRGKKHGHHHHGHHHGKKHPQAQAHSHSHSHTDKAEASSEHRASEEKRGISDTAAAAKDGAAATSATSSTEAAGAGTSTSNAQPKTRPQDGGMVEVDVRNWFGKTLPTGGQRSCAAAVTDPAFVDLFMELVAREEEAKAKGTVGGNSGNGDRCAPQYPSEELARLYGEYHRAAVAAAAANASGGGGGGGKKKGGKNKKAAAAAAATAAIKDKDEAGPGSASTKAKGDATETPTGTTATTGTATTGSTSSTTANTATATTATTTTTADDAYRIRGEGGYSAKDKNKVDKDNKNKEDKAGEEGPKMIIQYKSGLVVPVTRTSAAGKTNAGAAAATTRAVLAAAERTKNSPSSPTAGAGAAPASASASPIKTSEGDDDGDIGSTPSFSALGGGGGSGSGGSAATTTSGSAKVSADVDEAAALELASTITGTADAESSKKAKKKAKKARQQANKIVRAKQAAAQAMGRQAQASFGGAAGPSMAGSSSSTALLDQMQLLRHVRIVLPSALGFASPGKNPPSGGQEWGKPFGPVLVLEPDFVDGDSNGLLDLADKIIGQMIPGASFLSRSHSDWVRKISEAGEALSASILLLARMEVSICAACATATLGSHAVDEKEHQGTLRSILATSSSGVAVAAGTDAALQNALDLWVRICANENDEGLMLLSSKIHSDLHQDLSESYPFHLEDIIAAPLHLPSSSKAPSGSTEWSRWWNSTIIPPLRSIKKEMQSIPVLSGNEQSSGRATNKTNDAVVENSGQQSTPSKSKKKKKKKSKKKKAAAAAAAAIESGDALGSNVAENAIRTSRADNAPPSTPSVEAPSIKPSLSTDQSSADAADLSNQEAIQTQANTIAVTPTRGSITVGAGNNMVVGLGRMMEEEEHHDDGWETVPTKGAEKRNNNNSKKSGGGPDNKGAGGGGGGRHQQQSPSSGKKKKNKSKAARKKEQARRLVDDIISGILDNVEHEVDRRRRAALRAEGRIRANEERKRAAEAQNAAAGAQSKSASLRDVVVGASCNAQTSVDRTSSMRNVVDGEDRGNKQKSRGPKKAGPAGSPPTGRTPVSGVMPAETPKAGGSGDKASVGQKTAPTLPDTVSGRSTSGGTRGLTATVDKSRAPTATVSGVESSVSTDETATPGKTAATGAAQPPQDTSPQPPLPICNTVSASSSVASSLEAPHATRHRPRGRSHELKEDDVGYHLVKLCDKLSDEMAVFMERRAMALSIRRTERNALLGALQDAASKVFSGHARVETYGSCATQLDLPSSDLDVVICGLNDIDPSSNHQQGPSAQDGKGQQKGKGKKSKSKSSSGNNGGSSSGGSSESGTKQEGPNGESSSACASQQQPQHQPPQQPPHYQQYPPQYYQYYPPPSPSGLKVLRLAAELEMHPWAVQVKAIPTATVPVIKLLADPTRVPGGAMWMMQHQHMPPVPMPPPHPHPQPKQPQSQEDCPVVADGQGHGHGHAQGQPQQAYYNGPAGAAPMPFIHPGAMPWRGADIMNGLISIDITFEGPEHGGIGSTIFSQAFVHEVCTESNLPPEATAAVQMIMVIKELLAQRRLNEPYSGGLSSFAVLLLAVSVIRERKLIQDEMRRMEKQRRAVEAAVEGPSAAPKQSKSKKKASKHQNKNEADASRLTNADDRKQSQCETNGSKKDTDCSASVTSTTTPIAKASRTVKQESKQTQTDEGEATPVGQVSSKNSSEQSKLSKSTKQPGSTKATNDVPTSEKSAASKGGFSFKDALKGNAKPKAPPTKKGVGRDTAKQAESEPKAPSGQKSWASIAKIKSQAPAQPQAPISAESNKKESDEPKILKEGSRVPPVSTEDPPAKSGSDTGKSPASESDQKPNDKFTRKKNDESEAKQTEPAKKVSESTPITSASVVTESAADEQSKPQAPTASAAASAVSASASESVPARSGGGGAEESRRQLPFPQGSNDVLEVLCTGEPTAGKLLMHFLLFYGQHFESQATAVDVSGVHHPDFHRYRNRPYGSYRLSSYVPRHAGGSIDPVTGMYTVDPIVIYDPLEGCENNNVARSCFAWASIRSVFHQCYMTLSGACERGSGTNESSVGIGGSGRSIPRSNRPSRSSSAESGKATDDARQQQNHHGQRHEDPQQQQVESVLALLLSF